MKSLEHSKSAAGSRASAVQRISQPTKAIVDNRPQSIVQRKLQESIDRRTVPSVVQRVASRQVNRGEVLQRNIVKKAFKYFRNFIRGRRNQNNNQQVNAPQVQLGQQNIAPPAQIDDSLDAFVRAYEACRFYHSSKNASTDLNLIPSIDKHGLLVYGDRLANSEVGDVQGYSSIGGRCGEFSGHETKGVFVSTKSHRIEYQGTYSGPAVRLYLTPQEATRTGRTIESFTPLHDQPEPGLNKDGGGGLISRVSIPANQVTNSDIQDLINTNDPKLDTILRTIASHYPPGTAPGPDRLRTLLQEAINLDPQTNQRRLSNAQLDNVNNNNG